MTKLPRIYVAGHQGMVGSAITRQLLLSSSSQNIITRTRSELDLTNQAAVREFFKSEDLDQVYLAAAKVGGISANSTYPADFIYENLMVQANVIEAAFRSSVKKLIFLGSSCIYPCEADQPMREDALLTGPLEPTNEPYAVAKIAGIKMCESYNRQYGESCGIDYRSVMPTNLYGPGDNYHPENSHVIPALIGRIHNAKINSLPYVTIWGTGSPKREFLFVEDMATACITIMNLTKSVYDQYTQPNLSHINIGSGCDISISDLANAISEVIGYAGKIIFDHNKPDGAARKLMDSSRANKLGWYPKVELKVGLNRTYQDFLGKDK